MRVLMVAGESNPFIKSGGLADVVYALSRQLVKSKVNVSIAIPFYKKIKQQLEHDSNIQFLGSFGVRMNWRTQYCGIYKYIQDRITYYFIDNEQYFLRDGIYGFDDDIERFSFFNLAVMEMILNFKMKFDIIHLHDWQAGMVPVLYKEKYHHRIKNPIHFIVTIHNPAFQGLFPKEKLYDFLNLDNYLFDSGLVEFKGQVSFLKAAIMSSERITTVSPTHADEIINGSAGHGLEEVIKFRLNDFKGILNGIDYEEFNPNTDKFINKNYNSTNVFSSKTENKKALLDYCGLEDTTRPLYGLVSRLTWQKGIDLVADVIPDLIEKGANVVILGAGEYQLEQRLSFLQSLYKGRVYVYFGFNLPLSHLIYAASDFFLMPSLFEPCGIGQMIAMRYGTIPLVRSVGGLKDTVIPYNGFNLEQATGLAFNDFTKFGFLGPIHSSLDIYSKKKIYRQIVKNAMRVNNNWSKSSEEYLDLYHQIAG